MPRKSVKKPSKLARPVRVHAAKVKARIKALEKVLLNYGGCPSPIEDMLDEQRDVLKAVKTGRVLVREDFDDPDWD